ncbi:unnamed protein product, partial [marine sediment metagenome]
RFIATAEQQRRTNRGLEERRPPVVILYRMGRFDSVRQRYEGADFFTRQYLISDYLMKHYEPDEIVCDLLIATRGETRRIEDSWREALFRVRELYWLPFFWGEDRGEEVGKFAERRDAWSGRSLRASWRLGGEEGTGGEGALFLEEGQNIRSPLLRLDPWGVTYLRLRAKTGKAGRMDIRWKAEGEEKPMGGICFSLRPDGQIHSYLIRLASYPEWTWAGTSVEWLEIGLTGSGAQAEVLAIELLEWPGEAGS